MNLTYQDFQGQVSRVHRIKENTQKIFEEKFRLLRERRDQSLETEDDGSVHSEVTESHGNRTKMIHHTYPHYQPLDQ